MKIAAPATVVRARRRELAKVVTAQAARHADAGHSLRHVWQHLDHRSSFVAWPGLRPTPRLVTNGYLDCRIAPHSRLTSSEPVSGFADSVQFGVHASPVVARDVAEQFVAAWRQVHGGPGGGTGKDASPASAPHEREASARLPVSSTWLLAPIARWPGQWLGLSGSTITSWVSAPVCARAATPVPPGPRKGRRRSAASSSPRLAKGTRFARRTPHCWVRPGDWSTVGTIRLAAPARP